MPRMASLKLLNLEVGATQVCGCKPRQHPTGLGTQPAASTAPRFFLVTGGDPAKQFHFQKYRCAPGYCSSAADLAS